MCRALEQRVNGGWTEHRDQRSPQGLSQRVKRDGDFSVGRRTSGGGLGQGPAGKLPMGFRTGRHGRCSPQMIPQCGGRKQAVAPVTPRSAGKRSASEQRSVRAADMRHYAGHRTHVMTSRGPQGPCIRITPMHQACRAALTATITAPCGQLPASRGQTAGVQWLATASRRRARSTRDGPSASQSQRGAR
jgi:hypothetical protein